MFIEKAEKKVFEGSVKGFNVNRTFFELINFRLDQRKGRLNMGSVLEIVRIVLPLVIVGGMVVFVVLRMKDKYEKGALGKKKTKAAQNLLDSLIPFGLLIGLAFSVILSMFLPISLLSAITWGPGLGFLLGYVAYEIYSKKEESHS